LFTSLLEFLFGIRTFGARPAVRKAVCGMFARAEVDKDIANYDDNSEEFPAKFRFQVWLRDWDGTKDEVAKDLHEWTANTENGFGFWEQLYFVRTSDPKF
jgi:hypothetical protein